MRYLILFILVCSGTLLSITLIDYYQHQRDEFLDSVQKSLQCRRLQKKLVTMTTMKQVDIRLFSQEVRELMDCPWRLNLTHRELHRTELWSCCNASERLMVTRQNTNQNQSLTYDAERWRKRKVDQALWEMLPQTVPWRKGSLSRCAVVGSGGILQNSSCGAEIDNADYVIRFNLAPINKSCDVGVKTDLITANPSQIIKGYPNLQRNPGPMADRLSVYGHAHLLLPAFSFGYGTTSCFNVYHALRKARPQQEVVFFHPDYLFELGRFWRRHRQRAPRISTGLMLTSTALEICEQVHLYGFWPFPLDLSQNTLPHHYYDNVGPSRNMHAMPEEFLLLLQLHSQGALQLHVGPCTP
ncbi:alpha-2,8-sialyltransferase 8E-like isoform X1 [Coregonus clupeaformis]|uniref:alpha-2,8-sialyltransferase 8E-like isoform X1 n=2 Tax=Coregonus clupeaformis TaxID=59861 RepID=UPI001E1C6045|nr:alpha-2,8-sialyltransferase 8E-like isoform X1 [Coregonus clupeaformis]